MKSITTASLLALAFLFLAAPRAAAQSSSGSWQFYFYDEYLKSVDFDAATQADGSTAGSMLLSDDAPIYNQDVDGTNEPGTTDKYNGFYIKASFDGLLVAKTETGNQAVMSGTVRDSSILDLVGQRVLLTVADNGDNTRISDQLTWGVYRTVKRDWTPSDAERKEDPGVGLTWIATDAERKDDRGVPYPQKDEPAGTQTFPVSSYDFADFVKASGDIKVTP